MSSYEMNYKKSDIKAFFDENVKKKLLTNMIAAYSVIGLLVFLAFIGVGVVINDTLSFAQPLPYIFLGALAVIVALSIFRTLKKAPEKMYREFMEEYDDDTVTCSFDEDRLYIRNSDPSGEQSGYIEYENIVKAVESDNYFYIFVNKQNAQIIRKSAVVQGSPDETRAVLKKSLGKKYISVMKYREER